MTTPLSRFLESARRVCEGATEGPWLHYDMPGVRWDNPKACGFDSRANHRTAPYYCTGPRTETTEQASADAAFIAASRTALPTALAMLEWLANYAAEQAHGKYSCCGMRIGGSYCHHDRARAALEACAALVEKEASK